MDFFTALLKFLWHIVCAIALVVAVCLWLFFTHFVPFIGDQLGRYVNSGSYSLHARQEESREMFEQRIAADHKDTFLSESDRYMPTMEGLAGDEERFWGDYTHDVLVADFNKRTEYDSLAHYTDSQLESDDTTGPRLFRAENLDGTDAHASHLPSCVWDENYSNLHDTRLPDTLQDRRITVFMRKSARMSEAFREGAFSVAVLRNMLTQFKMGKKDVAPSGEKCDPDDQYRRIPDEAEWNAWHQAAKRVKITGAPKIELRLTHLLGQRPPGSVPKSLRNNLLVDDRDPGIEIMGMCVEGACSNEPTENFAFLASPNDLTSEPPLLTPSQEHAVQALEYLGSDAYWLEQAHLNGVHDDKTVLSNAAGVRKWYALLLDDSLGSPRLVTPVAK